MTALFQIIEDSEFSGATIHVAGYPTPFTVASDHPSWEEITTHLLKRVDDDEALVALINPAKGATDRLSKLSERFAYFGGRILHDGDPIESAVADHIVRLFESGDETGWKPLVNFLEKVATNPSKKSRKHLYHFIESNKMTLHPDGDLIAYKGVNRDGTSSNAGYGIVDGKVYGAVDEDGRLTKAEHLPNQVGSVIEIPRSMVDDDRKVACSTGLHVGAYSYASTFAHTLLRVKVNPRDVVSVPDDYNNQKVRVSRYLVIEVNDTEYDGPTYPDGDFTEVPAEPEQDEKTVDLDDAPVTALKDHYENPGDLVEDETDTADLSPEQVKQNAKIDAFVLVIKGLPDDKLRRQRNKKVTAKNRSLFDAAVAKAGRSYPA
jgi:hypothetical protein